MSFTDKVVLVTGGSSGIGAAAALHFAREGATVAIVGRNETKLNDVAAQITKIGKEPLIIKADVSTDDAKTIIKQTVDKFGKLDVLVNNAGIVRSAAIDDDNLIEVYDEVINTNLRSIFVLTNLAVPHLVKTKGSIVNISSVAGSLAMRYSTVNKSLAYCVSKAGLNQFTRYVAKELAPKGIRVNAISPGPVETPILENSGFDLNWETLKDITALKIITQSEEVADLILYLASDKARSVTGSDYVIDAGCLVY